MNQAMGKFVLLTFLMVCVPFYAPAADAATMIYMTMESGKQGALKGDSMRQGFQDKTEVLAYSYSVSMAASRGGRQHGPVRVTKRIGPSSPQLFQALVGNEVLRSVVIDFLATNQSTGQEYVATTVRLGSASVVAIDQIAGDPPSVSASAKHTSTIDAVATEQISFTFATIEITNHDAKLSAMDSVSGRP